jgi:hypothetical protein
MRIAINGAGIAGPTLAYWLRKMIWHRPPVRVAGRKWDDSGHADDLPLLMFRPIAQQKFSPADHISMTKESTEKDDCRLLKRSRADKLAPIPAEP